MLQPSAVISSILASVQSIPELATELGAPTIPPTESIIGHNFYSGQENAVARAIGQMQSPSILIAYLDLIQGHFDGSTIFKHRVTAYIRPRNAAPAGNGAVSAPDLLTMMLNYPISVPKLAPNIRCVDLLNNNLWLFSVNAPHVVDELGQDLWQATMVWNEYGDAGPDNMNFQCIGPAAQKVKELTRQREEILALFNEEEDTVLIEKVKAAYRKMIDEERM